MAQPQVIAQYFRLPIDVSKPAAQVADILSLSVPAVATGAALEFDFIFSDGPLADATICDLSVFDSIQFKIEANTNPHADTAYVAAGVAAVNFVNCSLAQWNGGNLQQVQVCIPAVQNVLQPGSGSQGQYWLTVYGVLSAAAAAAATPPRTAGDFVPLCYFAINAVDSGIPPGNPANPLPLKIGTVMSFLCGDGQTRDVTIAKTPNGKFTLNINQEGYNGPGQATFSLFCPAPAGDNLYHDLTLVLLAGVWTIDVNQAGHN